MEPVPLEFLAQARLTTGLAGGLRMEQPTTGTRKPKFTQFLSVNKSVPLF
jgi:hypothetical protein